MLLSWHILTMIFVISKSDNLSEFDLYAKLKTDGVSDFDVTNIIVNIYCQAPRRWVKTPPDSLKLPNEPLYLCSSPVKIIKNHFKSNSNPKPNSNHYPNP